MVFGWEELEKSLNLILIVISVLIIALLIELAVIYLKLAEIEDILVGKEKVEPQIEST